MKKYQYLASWDDQTLTRVGEPVVVLGDSNVSQVEVTLPSDFLLDPTGAVARMYFLLPGEKESGFETLETATKDDNGDSHVTWTVRHAHTQKGGRLAFSLTLIGDDAQWDSRTAIIPVYESRYQPESEEAEEPYTGRLDALEGSMAAIRGEFAEVQDDFEDLKETATLGTPIPESLVANMTEGHVYIYTGTEPGYIAGHVYYYVAGTLTDGGVYGGTAVDATLTQSGQAADAKVTGDEIAEIKEDLKGKAPAIYNASDDAEVVTFADGADDMPMKSVVLKLVPHQEGTGDPSPDNVRQISGYDSVTVTRTGQTASISDPTYEPRQSDTYPITLPQTVYGGTLDVVSGQLRVTKEIYTLTGNETWTVWGQSYCSTCLPIYSINNINTVNADGSKLKSVTVASLYNGSSASGVGVRNNNVYISKTDHDNITSLTGMQVVYDRLNPTKITLDPVTIKTLLGANTIWMDADGTIQCDYPADTKLYIDALTAPDDDMVADSNIASGKYFTVNNRLYLSTSAIAQGEAIMVGTNCTQTDLATALNAINA